MVISPARAALLPALVAACVLPSASAAGEIVPPALSAPRLHTCEGSLPGTCLRGPSPTTPPGRPSPRMPVAAGPGDCLLPGMDDRCEHWAVMYDNQNGYGAGGFDQALGIAAAGGRVFATGGSYDDTTAHYDVLTAAYAETTGEQLWTARDDGPAHALDAGFAVAATDGTVYVTGTADGDLTEGGALLTVARDAATGDERWESRYDGPAGGTTGYALAIDPAARYVYVAGWTHSTGGDHDMIVAAYDAASGGELWVRTYGGPAGGDDLALSIEATSEAVFVTGPSFGGGGSSNFDYATLAYAAAGIAGGAGDAGRLLWIERYDGGTRGHDESTSLGTSADGSVVYVTGGSARPQTDAVGPPPYAFTTIAYDAISGERLWLSRYEPRPALGSAQNFAYSLAVGGGRVFVAGLSPGSAPNSDYGFATVAYHGATGAELWAAPFHPPGSTYGIASSVVVTPDGHNVVTTGPSFEGYFVYKGDVATVAHDAATGTQSWAAKFSRVADDVADLLPYPSFAATSEDGTRAFVTGTYVNYCCDTDTGLTSNFSDYWTLAYEI